MTTPNRSIPSLSIVLPTYNERENIERFVPLLETGFADVPHEIIVVDDSSPDGTGEAVRQLAQRFPAVRLSLRKEKQGIGAALRHGYDEARCDIILSCDADLSFSVPDLRKIYAAAAGEYDLVIGSRHSPASFYEKRRPAVALKFAVSRIGNRLLHALFRIPVKDFSVNCRAIRRKVWQGLEPRGETQFFLFSMVFLARKKGFRIGEVPVAFADRKFGHSKINHAVEVPKALYKMFVYLLTR